MQFGFIGKMVKIYILYLWAMYKLFHNTFYVAEKKIGNLE